MVNLHRSFKERPIDRARVPTTSRWISRLGVAALAIAFLELLSFGVMGIHRKSVGFFDSVYYHAAGRALLAGKNPYDPAILRAHADGGLDERAARLYYPPQSAPFFMMLGLFRFDTAKIVLMLINLAATVGLCFLAIEAVGPPRSVDGRAAIPWLIPAILIGDPWFVDALWYGGVVPLVTLFLMGGWLLAERGRPILAGILLGLATLKPQFALLPLIWMVCERRWKVLGVAAATALVCMVYPLALLGPESLFGSWLGDVSLHREEFCNALGFPHLMGVSNLAYAFGVTLPGIELLAILLTIALWAARRRFRQEDILGILAAMSVTLLAAHDYDLALLVPLLVAFWRHLAGRPREAAVALALAGILLIPGQLVDRLPFPWAAQRSTVGALLLLAWLLRLSSRGRGETEVRPELAVDPAGGPDSGLVRM